MDLPVIVYVIRSGGLCKIGRTTDFKRRLTTLATTNPAPVEVVATGLGDAGLELELHRAYAHCRQHGGWFRLDDEDLEEIKDRLHAPHIGAEASRRRPDGSVKHLGGDRWRLWVELNRDPVTGDRRRATRTVRAANRREALGRHAAVAAELRASDQASHPRDVTVDELLDRWLAHVRPATDAEAGKWTEWCDALRRYVRPHLGPARIAEVEPYDVDQLYRKLQHTGGRDGRALKASTVRDVHTPLRLAFAQAVRWRWLAANPLLDVDPPRPAKVHLPPPPAGDVARLLAWVRANDKDLEAMVAVFANAGPRRGELAGLQWRDVDLDGGELALHRVVKRVGRSVAVVDYPKTSSSRRRIALGPATVALLRGLRVRSVERALATGVRIADDAFLWSPAVDGRRPPHPMTFTTRLARASARAGVSHITPQPLRRFMATQALGAGVDVRTVAGRGGWANPTTLLTRYAHFLPARDQAAAATLEQLLVVEDDVGEVS